MNTVQIRLYDLFRNELKLSDDKAAAFVEAVDEAIELEVRKDSSSVASKEDIRRLDTNIHGLEIKLEQTKTDLYKAMFWTGLVQLLAILGGVMSIVKFIK